MSRIVLFSALLATGMFAQSQKPAFEVVSIKSNTSGADDNSMHTSPGHLTVVNMTPRELLLYAFGVKETQLLGGPDWLNKEKFDLVAVTGTSADLNRAALQPLLQSLFADRFQLKFHRENKESPIYSLVVAKGGPKLAVHSGEAQSATGIHSRSGHDRVNATKTSMKRLAEVLSEQTDRFVIDNTGLSAEYDFILDWASDPIADSQDPSIFPAIQEQLGLRLETAKGPVEVIVIDSARRPSDN